MDITIPSWIRSDERLTPIEKLIMGEVITLSKNSGYCWASNSYWAKIHGVSPRSVTRCLSELVEKNLIVIQYVTNPDGSTERRITPLDKLSTPLDKLSTNYILYNTIYRDTQFNKDQVSNNSNSLYKENNAIYSVAPVGKNSEPGLLDVQKFFVGMGKSLADGQKFYDHYSAIGWTLSGTKIVDWRALARKWISKMKPEPKLKVFKNGN